MASCDYNGKMKTTVKDNTGKAGSASNRGSAFSVSPGSGMKTNTKIPSKGNVK